MTNSITKLPNGDFKVNALKELQEEVKRFECEESKKPNFSREFRKIEFPMLKGKKNETNR